MKVLVVCCNLNEIGGVSSFLNMLRRHMDGFSDFFSAYHANGLFGKIFCTLFNQFRFLIAMLFGEYDAVVLNPSLRENSVFRDSVYAFLTKRVFRKKLLVFWHGWNFNCQKKIEKKYLCLMRNTFFLADKTFVLASSFAQILRKWGCCNRIEIFTTCYDENGIQYSIRDYRAIHEFRILYLSRIEIEKGILIVLKAFHALQKNIRIPLSLVVAGDGSALQEAKQFVNDKHIQNVIFKGFVQGVEKQKALQESSLFFFPSYGEGMPCALLEAMGSGLPVVVSAVGGIPDFFQNGKMGYMIDSQNPEDYCNTLTALLSDPEKMNEISKYNAMYADKHFKSEKVASWITEKIQELICEEKK